MVDWSAEEMERFLGFQFSAQHEYCEEQFSAARFGLVVDGEPGGRLYVDRRADEIRLIDIARCPRSAAGGSAAS